MKREPLETAGTNSPRIIAPNVWEFIFRAADIYGRIHSDRFGQGMQAAILEGRLESPIEDLFWIALDVMCEAYGHPFNPDPDMEDGKDFSQGVFCYQQQNVGPYRVDFILTRTYLKFIGDKCEVQSEPSVVVELDGHEFHDKDKRQRSYEKARDRYLVQRGLRVLHFTGSDVVADPFKVAFEVLQTLKAFQFHPDDFAYDPDNPAGIG